MKKLRPLHDGKGIVMSGRDYKTMTSALGCHGDEELESVTQTLTKKVPVCILNFVLPKYFSICSETFWVARKQILFPQRCCAELGKHGSIQAWIRKIR